MLLFVECYYCIVLPNTSPLIYIVIQVLILLLTGNVNHLYFSLFQMIIVLIHYCIVFYFIIFYYHAMLCISAVYAVT